MDGMIESINARYSALSTKTCCLSCGGAVNHADARPGEACVDLGSGRGLDVLRLADEVGPAGHVYGVDVSDGMLATARRNAEKQGVTNASFIQSKLDQVPLEDASVDLVLSNCTINHAPDKQAVWDEVFRILRRGGRFVVSDIYATEPVPSQYADDPEVVAECWAGASTRDEYLRTLAQAGFTEVTILEESEPYEKGAIQVSSITIAGVKPSGCCS